MKTLKKVVAVALAFALTVSMTIGATVAYLTEKADPKHNVFTVGNIDIELDEKVGVTGGGNGELVTDSNGVVTGAEYTNIVPGDYLQKEVTVKNTGISPAYVAVTVTLNNADRINRAIDDHYEGLGLSAEEVQAKYDEIFDGWHINYNPRPGAAAVNDARGVIDGTYGLPEHVLKVDFAKTTDYDNDTFMFGIKNWFKNDVETAAAAEGKYSTHPAIEGYYTSTLDDDPATEADERDYNIIYTYYLYLESEEESTLFNGLKVPFEFDAEQLKMFENLVIDIEAEAIQADNMPNAKAAFNVLKTGNLPFAEVTPENINNIDFSEEGVAFTLTGDFDYLTIAELGESSTLTFDGVTTETITLPENATITGNNDLTANRLEINSENGNPVLNILDAKFTDSSKPAISVSSPTGISTLNIENSEVYFSTIFVGAHTLQNPEAKAVFNVKNSYISGEEDSLGSTIAIWGQAGVESSILDSEIHTYSRGWHQSEDANDNAITFQGANTIDVDIQRSNMHLYGARSIINARKYGSTETTVDFNIDDSLIWVVTKSNHADETLPVWGGANITNSILLFTKNVHQSTPAEFDSFVYDNPVIHGNYAVTTQCQWPCDIEIPEGQTVTFAPDANISIYDGAAEVNFIGNVVNPDALTNIGVK